MRKITSILMLLLFVFSSGVSAQGIKVSTDTEKHWYQIKNFRSGKYAAFGGETADNLKDICQKDFVDYEKAFYWYVVKDGEGYRIHNLATTKVVNGHGWSDAGCTMYITASQFNSGYYTISSSTNLSEDKCWDGMRNGTDIGDWHPTPTDNEGTSWEFVEATIEPTDLNFAKGKLQAAITKAIFLVGVNPGQYPSTDAYSSALAAAQEILNSATATKEDYDGRRTELETALAEATDAQTKTKNDLEVGCYYRIQNTHYKTYTGIVESGVKTKGTGTMKNFELDENDPRQIWQLKQEGKKYYLVNVASGLYPQNVVSGTDKTTSVGAMDASKDFTWKRHADASSASNAQYNIMVGGTQINVESTGNVNYWYGDDAHHYLWKVEKTDAEILTLVNNWAKSQNLTAKANATKLQVIDGVTQIIPPNEFAAPSVVNDAIDKVGTYVGIEPLTLVQAQELYVNYAIVKNYEDMAEAYGGILDVEYDLKGQYGTIILPVNYEIPQNVKFYTCSAADANGVLTLKKIDSGSKNQPYIVEYTGTDMPTVDNPKKYQIIGYKKGAATTNQTVGLLTGVLVEGGYVPSGSYILSKYNGRFAFYMVDGENVKKAQQYRCYLTNSTPSPVSAFYLNGEGETTGINALLNGNNGETEIYDLSGKRLNHLQKGINIVNGQKVLVK